MTRLTHEEASACAALRSPSEASRRFPFAAQEAIRRLSGCAVAVPSFRLRLHRYGISFLVRHRDVEIIFAYLRLSATPLSARSALCALALRSGAI